jgi:hypothetical protein
MMIRWVALAITSVLFSACMAPMNTPPAKAQAPAPTPMVAPQPATPSALSYGTVTSQVRKGETTQLDLVRLFGGPNISTYDSAGIETWEYERTVTQTDVQSNSQAAAGAANLGVFFNWGQVGGGVSGSQASSSASTTTSVRSITVIVKFAANKTVSDYSVRASYF